MSAISLRLSESMHNTAIALAERDNVSLNQFIALAVAEKVSALGTEDILRERATRGDRSKFLAALDKAPDVDEEYDREQTTPTVEEVISGQLEPVQRFVHQIEKLLEADDVTEFTTNTIPGGDLRFRHENGIFAEIKFKKTKEEVDLRLYFEPDTKLGGGFKRKERTGKQCKYDIRLDVNQPIGNELKSLLARSREFMRNKRS